MKYPSSTPLTIFAPSTHFQSLTRQQLYNRLALAACLLAGWLYREPLWAFVRLFGDREAIVEMVNGLGLWGPLALVGMLFIQVFLAIIPGHLLMVAAAYLYGFGAGLLMSWLTVIPASQLAFWLARRYGRPIVDQMVPAEVLTRWDAFIHRGGPMFFFFVHVLPVFPTDAMAFVAGISPLSTRKYILINFVAHLPNMVVMALLGAYGFSLPPVFWMAVAAGLALVYFGWKNYSRRVQGAASR